MRGEVEVIDEGPAEAAARAVMESWQAEQRFELRGRRRGPKARIDPIDRPACTPAGRSVPSGPAIDWRVTALALLASAVVLPLAFVGYLGIAGALWGWDRLKGSERHAAG